MKLAMPLCAVVLIVAALAWGQNPVVKDRSPATAASATVEGDNAFALDLYAHLAETEGNLFFSPGSIRTALAMTCAGAQGKTAQQMARALHLNVKNGQLHASLAKFIKDLNAPGKKYEISVANALWGQKGFTFKPAFLDLVKENYGAALNDVDFTAPEDARKTINDWVAKATKDKIKDLILPGMLDAQMRLVLTNAIYLKGKWDFQFKPADTREEPFRLAGGKTVAVPLMNQTSHFGYMEGDGFQMLALPYAGDDLSMIILLPGGNPAADPLPSSAGDKSDKPAVKPVPAADKEDVKALEKKLTAKDLLRWIGKLTQQKVKVALPKFKTTQKLQLEPTLATMGIKDAFDPNAADFSAMSDQDKLFISAVVHKAFVDVNEEGTEAAAATEVGMRPSAAPPIFVRITPIFRADHPFIFLIRHNASGNILFIGRMTNPTE